MEESPVEFPELHSIRKFKNEKGLLDIGVTIKDLFDKIVKN